MNKCNYKKSGEPIFISSDGEVEIVTKTHYYLIGKKGGLTTGKKR